jgi:hypothetical protein
MRTESVERHSIATLKVGDTFLTVMQPSSLTSMASNLGAKIKTEKALLVRTKALETQEVTIVTIVERPSQEKFREEQTAKQLENIAKALIA